MRDVPAMHDAPSSQQGKKKRKNKEAPIIVQLPRFSARRDGQQHRQN
jgi:hypothetical protein